MYYIQKSKFNLQTAFSSEYELTKHSRCIISLFRELGPIHTERKRKRSKNKWQTSKQIFAFAWSEHGLTVTCSQRTLQISIANFHFRNMTLIELIRTKPAKSISQYSHKNLLFLHNWGRTEFWIHSQLDSIILPR